MSTPMLARRRYKAPFHFISSSLFLFAVLCTLLASVTQGQIVQNDQLCTNGLTIVNSPALQNTFNAGSEITISIDVSGNGVLPQSASILGNSGSDGYDGLDLYLVSDQTNTNITISNNSDILKLNPGSPVKILNWPVPSCLAPGQYNLTLYECARIDGEFFYTIMPIAIDIVNPNASGPCTSAVNQLDSQPQASSPPLRSPFLPTVGQPTSPASLSPTSLGFVTSFLSAPSQTKTGPQALTTFTISSGASLPFIMGLDQTTTVTQTASQSTVTVVVVSLETLISTAPGQTSVSTVTQSSTATVTGAIGTAGIGAGFYPVNAALRGGFSIPKLILMFVVTVVYNVL